MDHLETSTSPSPVTTEGLHVFHMDRLGPSAPSTAAPVHTTAAGALSSSVLPSSRGAPPNIGKNVTKQPKKRRRRKELSRRNDVRLCDKCRSIRCGLLPCQICRILDKGCKIEAEAPQPTERHAAELTPPLAFLHRARHTIATTMLQRDQPFDFSGEVRYPPKSRWDTLLEEFFTGWHAAAHFIHRRSLIEWKEQVRQNVGAAGGVDIAFGVGNVRAATVLLSLAMGSLSRHREPEAKENELDSWIWTLNFGDKMFQTARELLKRESATFELAQPTLELAQAHLMLDMYQLSTNRVVLAWHFFGATVQLMKSLGLHTGRNIDIHRTSRWYYAKIQSERRLFWSAYVFDRQISFLTRRPNRWNDVLIGPHLPQSVDLENPDQNGAVGIAPSHCYAFGLIHRVSLARLFDKIRNQVYSHRSELERLAKVVGLYHELKEWHKSRPRQLTKPWCSPYGRQAVLLELGYRHALILATRPFLMKPYAEQSGKKTLVHVDSFLNLCCLAIKRALQYTADIARVDADPRMFQALWYVHQVSFCCISTFHLLRRIREGKKKRLSGQALSTFNSEDAELRELADRATKTLAEDTGQYSAGPGYAIILNELKEEVLRQNIRGGQGQQLWDGWKIADWLDLDSAARATLLPPRNFAESDQLYMLADTIPRTR